MRTRSMFRSHKKQNIKNIKIQTVSKHIQGHWHRWSSSSRKKQKYMSKVNTIAPSYIMQGAGQRQRINLTSAYNSYSSNKQWFWLSVLFLLGLFFSAQVFCCCCFYCQHFKVNCMVFQGAQWEKKAQRSQMNKWKEIQLVFNRDNLTKITNNKA